MNGRKLLLYGLSLFYLLLWVGGVGTYIALGAPPDDAAWTAPVFLLLAFALVALPTPRSERRDLALIAAAGFASELLGVTTGIIFGEYHYTDALAPRVLGVPVVMTCAWTVLMAYVRQIVRSLAWHRVALAVTGALWMTAIDLVIDPLAAGRLGYWRWAEPGPYYGIPLHNFAGWFIVSLAILLLLPRPAEPSPWTSATGWSIVLFFSAIALATGLYVPGGIGLVLSAAHPLLALRRRQGQLELEAAGIR